MSTEVNEFCWICGKPPILSVSNTEDESICTFKCSGCGEEFVSNEISTYGTLKPLVTLQLRAIERLARDWDERQEYKLEKARSEYDH